MITFLSEIISAQIQSTINVNKTIPNEYNFYQYEDFGKPSNQDIEKLLQENLSTKEFTIKLQSIIDNNSIIVLPNKSIVVSEKGLLIRSNKTLVFQKNTILKIEPNNLERYGIINIIGSNNIKIINAKIQGDRDSHKSDKGEWGHGINILGGKDITIQNFIISNCWGDGIYIGRNNNEVSQNITINQGVVLNNRRNGISITSVNRTKLNKITSAYTNGTAPEFGIDVEPNSYLDEIQNVEIIDFISYYNQNGGLSIGLNKIGIDSPKIKNISVSVNGFKDYGSYYGVYVGNITSGANKIIGNLDLMRLSLTHNQHSLYIKSNRSSNFKIGLWEFDVIKPKNKNADKKEHLRVFKLRSDIIIK